MVFQGGFNVSIRPTDSVCPTDLLWVFAMGFAMGFAMDFAMGFFILPTSLLPKKRKFGCVFFSPINFLKEKNKFHMDGPYV